jgi:hypothetical protein
VPSQAAALGAVGSALSSLADKVALSTGENATEEIALRIADVALGNADVA